MAFNACLLEYIYIYICRLPSFLDILSLERAEL